MQIANIWSEICIDSAAKPGDMHMPIGLWPCHGQGGNQVFKTHNLHSICAYTYAQHIHKTYNFTYTWEMEIASSGNLFQKEIKQTCLS